MTGRRTLALSLVTGCAWLACEPPCQEEARPVEPRLTETAVYKPCRIDETASDLVPDAICGQRAALKAPPVGGEAVRGAGTPAATDGTSREAGLGDLLADGGLDELKLAVRRLEETVAAEPHDARAWSDLAAVYLVRAQRADEPRDLLRAYQAASRAVREDGSLREARFNQALALERLFLRDAARAAWQSYRELDDSSAWAEEAARRKEALARPLAKDIWARQEKRLHQAALGGNTGVVVSIVGRYRQAAREYAEHRLFGAWADAVLAGRPDLAADRRRVLEAIGEALLQTSGEHLVHDSVVVIEEAAGDPLRWQ